MVHAGRDQPDRGDALRQRRIPASDRTEAPFAVMITLMGTTSMAAATELIFSPVFHKHPNLKVAFSEGGVGWMPYLVERADYVWRKHKYYQNIHPTVAPSELFRRNIAGCFIEDEVGMAMRYEIGIDNITWECDYRHSDSSGPRAVREPRRCWPKCPMRRPPRSSNSTLGAGMPSPRRVSSPALRTLAGARTAVTPRLRLRRGHGGPRRGRHRGFHEEDGGAEGPKGPLALRPHWIGTAISVEVSRPRKLGVCETTIAVSDSSARLSAPPRCRDPAG